MGTGGSKDIAKSIIDPASIPTVEFRINTAMRKSILPSLDDLHKQAISPPILNEQQLEARVKSNLDYCVKEEWTLPTQSPEECKAVLAYMKQVMGDPAQLKNTFYSKNTGFDEELLIKKPPSSSSPREKDRGLQRFNKAFPELKLKLQGKRVVSTDALFAGFNMNGRKKSQDSTLLDYVVTPQGCCYLLMADFDGHGEYGTEISTFASTYIAGQLAKTLPPGPPRSSEKVFKAIKETFKMVQTYLEREEFEKSSLSGTTATCLLVTNDTVYCAYVGDSKAFILRDDKLQLMLRPHHFDEEVERDRALKEGKECSIRKVQIRPGVEAGPLRIFVKGTESPGLAMSRSLGDCEAHRVGVSASPEFMEIDISTCKSFQLMAGSDGLWDEIEPDEALKLLYSFRLEKGLIGGVGGLLQESCRRWAHKQVGIVDDISLVSLFFNIDDLDLEEMYDDEELKAREHQAEEEKPKGS